MRARAGAGLAALLLVLVTGTPGWAEEWFDAYYKGLDALRRGDGAKAAASFERAVKKRPQPGEDVLTYGTNRLDHYHPYVHLAESYLLLGDLDAAQVALRRSDAMGKEPPAARARLAKEITAAVAKKHAAAAPVAPPTVPVAPPTTATASPQQTAPSTTLAQLPPPTSVPLARSPLPLPSPSPRRAAPPAVPRAVPTPAVETTPSPTADATVAPTPRPLSEAPALVVYSEPAGAAVYLDDEPLGHTDPSSGRFMKTGVTPGGHRLRLSRPGHADVTEDVAVASSGLTTIRLSLPPVPAASWPFFGLGAALLVVVAGAAAWVWRRRATERPSRTMVLPRRAGTAAPAPSATITGRRTVAVLRTAPGARAGGSGPPGPVTPAPATPRPSATALPRSAPPGTVVSPDQSQFGDYRLTEMLGKGGMAAVFKAERGGEYCALKRPLGVLLEDAEFLERFLREAEIGRTLHHPNIIRIFERGEVNGVPFFTMELVNGETLQKRLRVAGALDGRAAAHIVIQVAEALDYAHLKGVVHRDLKPSNIMILEDGDVKVMDYGIARARRFDGLTVTGAFLGTPDYVAPETAEGKGADARSDLYALGIIFYELLTGKRPFAAETPFATLRKHCTEPPTPPSAIAPGIPRELEAMILKLLRKDPAERYPTAEELLIELRAFLNRAA